jgi:hypothetical protein
MVTRDNDQQSDSQRTIANLDYKLRQNNDKVVLFTSDYAAEKPLETALYIASELKRIYQKKILVFSLDEGAVLSSQHQNLNQEELKTNAGVDENKLSIYFEECKKYFDHVLIVPELKLQVERTELPKVDVDGAYLLRSSKSIGIKKKRYVTQLIQDNNIAIHGMLMLEGLQ